MIYQWTLHLCKNISWKSTGRWVLLQCGILEATFNRVKSRLVKPNSCLANLELTSKAVQPEKHTSIYGHPQALCIWQTIMRNCIQQQWWVHNNKIWVVISLVNSRIWRCYVSIRNHLSGTNPSSLYEYSWICMTGLRNGVIYTSTLDIAGIIVYQTAHCEDLLIWISIKCNFIKPPQIWRIFVSDQQQYFFCINLYHKTTPISWQGKPCPVSHPNFDICSCAHNAIWLRPHSIS